MGSLASPLARIGILSIGDMGLGIAKLLIANNYQVLTNASDRSPATQTRARTNSIDLVPSDQDLVNGSDFILSIVPPRDAIATAQRIVAASTHPRNEPLYFLDLNAISPASARSIAALCQTSSSLRFIDGGIIGGPPKLQTNGTWTRPSIPTSGPHRLDRANAHLAQTLHVSVVNEVIGAASGLKCCFASLSKGFTALAIQSFTTASNLDIIPQLREHLAEFNPAALKQAEGGLVGMCPKAYRWVHEMREISECFEQDGGFEKGESSFGSIAAVYELVAEGRCWVVRLWGEEEGLTVEDVAAAVAEGTGRRKEKVE